jgi:hypothetical protein
MSTPLARAGPKFAEKWLGIGKLKPPMITDETKKQAEFPVQIQLGDYKLQMDNSTGKWVLLSSNAGPLPSPSPLETNALSPTNAQQSVNNTNAQFTQLQTQLQQSQQTVIELQRKLAAAEQFNKTLSSNASNSGAAALYEAEKKSIEIEKANLTILHENNQLRFKNKVLMAMCAISEGDYKALCREAGIEPRDRPKRIEAIKQATVANNAS